MLPRWPSAVVAIRPETIPVGCDSGEWTPERGCDFSVGGPIYSHLLKPFTLFCAEFFFF